MQKHYLVIECLLLVINVIALLFIFYSLKEVPIENLNFKRNTKVINLNNLNKIDIQEISNSLDEFFLLKEVDFGSINIEKADKVFLENKYPNVNFKANLVVDVYGNKIKDNVTYLDLSTYNLDDNLENILKEFPSLKEVILIGQDLSTNEEINLKNNFPNIKFNFTINIADKTINSTEEELDLKDTDVTYEEVNKIIPLFNNLKKLDLSNTKLTNEECNQFRIDYPNIETNWIVHLGRWSLRTDDVAFSVLIKYFDYVPMTSDDIEVLKYCTKLKALDLGHQNITDISVIGDYLPELRILILADNKITDISPISKLKHLHYLELFINPVSDISPLKENKELVDLNLANLFNVKDITPILDLPLLERLWVNNMGIGYSGIQTLMNTYPDVLMATTGNQSTHQGWRSHPRYFQMIDMFYNNYYGDEFAKYDNLG